MERRASIARGLIATLTAAALTAALGASPAAAHHPSPISERILEKALGENPVERDDGLYEIRVQGPDLLTHGPDPELKEGAAPGEGFSAGAPERDPACAGSNVQHVLYGRLVGSGNGYAASVETIRTTMRRSNAVLNRDSLASGGPTADYRVRCTGSGEIRVDAFTAVGFDFNAIVNGARAAGFDATDTDYTVFFDSPAGGACGIGSYYDDDRLVAGNYNNTGGGYAVVYKGCWQNETAMHENAHNQGAVQYAAPYSTGTGGHCWDDLDVMCYAPDGGDLHQGGTISRCTDRTYFDCGFDTYFDSAPEPGEWLDGHWNLGSPLNRFIEFGLGGGSSGGSSGSGGSGSGDGGSGGSGPGGGAAPREPVRLIGGIGDLAQSALTGGWTDHYVKVPRRAKKLKVKLRGPACSAAACDPDLDLYLRHRRTPTLEAVDCVSEGRSSRETCKLSKPRRGRWYIGVYAAQASDSATYRVRAVIKKKRRRR